MTYRTTVLFSFVGIFLLLLGFFVLPWYAPLGKYTPLKGPVGWEIATLPVIATPNHSSWIFILVFWILVLIFWILAALIFFACGCGILAWQQKRSAQVSRFYKISGKIGLIWVVMIAVIICIDFAALGLRSILLTLSGLGFWSCFLGFLIVWQMGARLEHIQRDMPSIAR
jgi:hypothetical protein